MHNTLKTFIFTALLAPMITQGMESEPDRIELGIQLMKAAGHYDCTKIKTLIDRGADLNQKDADGWTTLMIAAWLNYPKIVRMLIDAGADLNQKDDNGRTALMIAANCHFSEIYRPIVQAQLTNIARQKERVNTASLCLKRIFGLQYPHIRNIFRPILEAMIQEVRQPMLDDINQIKKHAIKQELLALINAQQRKKKSSRCTIL